MSRDDLKTKYEEFAVAYSEYVETEKGLHNYIRLVDNLKRDISSMEPSSAPIEMSAHSFKQISERLEDLAMENSLIYDDVFNAAGDCLLAPSNLKSFVYTMISKAINADSFTIENSRHSSGSEYRYTVDIEKWSGVKTLQFTAIVENNCVKTGYFNWV